MISLVASRLYFTSGDEFVVAEAPETATELLKAEPGSLIEARVIRWRDPEHDDFDALSDLPVFTATSITFRAGGLCAVEPHLVEAIERAQAREYAA